jgi:hypothetical protein
MNAAGAAALGHPAAAGAWLARSLVLENEGLRAGTSCSPRQSRCAAATWSRPAASARPKMNDPAGSRQAVGTASASGFASQARCGGRRAIVTGTRRCEWSGDGLGGDGAAAAARAVSP